MNYTQPLFGAIPTHGHGGYAPYAHHHFTHGGSGFCASCCHPRSKCCCGHRECRKEAKELLVEADTDVKNDNTGIAAERVRAMAALTTPLESLGAGEKAGKDAKAAAVAPIVGSVDTRGKLGTGKAFIGGGCCVHLSIEYTPNNAAANVPSIVYVLVVDSEKTYLAWAKQIDPQDGYQIKEGIITTKPGAHMTVLVLNATARVRWCEVFSC